MYAVKFQSGDVIGVTDTCSAPYKVLAVVEDPDEDVHYVIKKYSGVWHTPQLVHAKTTDNVCRKLSRLTTLVLFGMI